MNVTPVILSGGSGSRLWPVSRELYPKQLLAMTGEKTMLQETVNRLQGLNKHGVVVESPLVICNEEHRFLVAEQLRAVAGEGYSIVLEPVGRNTAPALTLAALQATRNGGDAVLLVMPADHVIRKQNEFLRAVAAGAVIAERNILVTFGIVPTAPETGYGYIRTGEKFAECDAYKIAAFVEKPNEQQARDYISSGEFLWNSGMFMMRASVWLEEIGKHRMDILTACRTAMEKAVSDYDFCRIDKKAFSSCPSDSIDYAVMEKVGERGAVIPLDADWSDVGAWSSLWEVLPKDGQGNVIKGDAIVRDSSNSMVMGNSRLLAVIGVDNLLVIETADAVLVANKDRAQDVKAIVQTLQKSRRNEHVLHRKVHRPWGTYEGIDAGERYQVKRITVNPGASLSLQMHHHRAEHWVVVRGTARVTCGDNVFIVTENQSTYIPIGAKHRLENIGKVQLELIEVQSGSYLGEDDIVRFEDIYGR